MPNCLRLTTRPDPASSESALRIGVASHITAAAPGGPRHDPSLTSEQRKSADNGIWLCEICARSVDASPEAYTAETLRGFKKHAEARAARLTKIPPGAIEIEQLVQAIEDARNSIYVFIAEQQETDPTTGGWPVSSPDEWHEYANAVVKYSQARRNAYCKDIEPVTTDIIQRATRLTGPANPVVEEAAAAADAAPTNYLSMSAMAKALQRVATELQLR